MGFVSRIKAGKKRIEVAQIKREQRTLTRLRKQRVKTESKAIRSKLRQKEEARITKAKKILRKGKKKGKKFNFDIGDIGNFDL